LSDDLEAKITGINGIIANMGSMKGSNTKDFKEALVEILSKFIVPTLTDQGSLISDPIKGMIGLEDRINGLLEAKEKDTERIKLLETCRESIELKGSKKEMTEKVAVASKQFKIMDVDFGKEYTDRKVLIATAKEKMAEKIRSDKKSRYEDLVKNALMQVLARATTKRKDQGGSNEIWTAPILVTVEDRETRWELEDILRSCHVHPTFHWNREMVGLVKEMRGSIKEKYPEDKLFIRVRPEERDGRRKIKADVKAREGEGNRFRLGATWDVPPMCANVRKADPGWVKPTWAQVAAMPSLVGEEAASCSNMEQ
jgi:hypothetical protein